MGLLDLPPELLEHVIRHVVEYYGPVQAVKLRLVCNTFAVFFRADILRDKALLDTKYDRRPKLFERLTHTYGADLLQARIKRVSNPLSESIEDIVNRLMREEQSSSKAICETYEYSICRAVCEAIGWASLRNYLRTGQLFNEEDVENIEPTNYSKDTRCKMRSAAAAVGNLEYLQSLTPEPHGLIEGRSQYLPSVLDTAVITGNSEVVRWILNHPDLESVRNSPHTNVTSSYVRTLGRALSIASRTHHNDVGLLIVESCLSVLSRRGFGLDTHGESETWMDDAIQSASEYGNGEIFLQLLACHNRLQASSYSLVLENGLGISSDRLFEKMSRHTALHILQERAINTNQIDRHAPAGLLQRRAISLNRFGVCTPMHLAMERGRYDIVALLLEQGADINACDYGGFGKTALEHAANKSEPCLPSVQFLIENGSDPRVILNREDAETAKLRNLLYKIIGYPSDGVLRLRTRDGWRALWETERDGLLKGSWQLYERITATVDGKPYVDDSEGPE